MNELDAIQASLASFTKRLDEVSTDRFNELRKCSFFDPVPSEWLTPIAEQTVIKTFAAADHLTSEGEDMNAFYVVLYGRLLFTLTRKSSEPYAAENVSARACFLPTRTFRALQPLLQTDR